MSCLNQSSFKVRVGRETIDMACSIRCLALASTVHAHPEVTLLAVTGAPATLEDPVLSAPGALDLLAVGLPETNNCYDLVNLLLDVTALQHVFHEDTATIQAELLSHNDSRANWLLCNDGHELFVRDISLLNHACVLECDLGLIVCTLTLHTGEGCIFRLRHEAELGSVSIALIRPTSLYAIVGRIAVDELLDRQLSLVLTAINRCECLESTYSRKCP